MITQKACTANLNVLAYYNMALRALTWECGCEWAGVMT